jgi:hypothetical protein
MGVEIEGVVEAGLDQLERSFGKSPHALIGSE